jgi:hypothetical protein
MNEFKNIKRIWEEDLQSMNYSIEQIDNLLFLKSDKLKKIIGKKKWEKASLEIRR